MAFAVGGALMKPLWAPRLEPPRRPLSKNSALANKAEFGKSRAAGPSTTVSATCGCEPVERWLVAAFGVDLDAGVGNAYNVCMKRIQYTIRNIPPQVDKAIKKRAKQTGKSFNQTVVDILSVETLGTAEPPFDESFDWLFGRKTLDADFDEAMKKMSQVDKKLWQ